MAYSGTSVATGYGAGVVVATALRTEIGRISRLLVEIQPLATPLLRKMQAFGRRLTMAILVLAAATFAVGVLLRGYPAEEMVLASVGLAVAAIPEGLPAILTIILAIGVQRMARRNALIRHLPVVETLGTVTVICSDKTGTLTRNELTVTSIVLADEVIDGDRLWLCPARRSSFAGATAWSPMVIQASASSCGKHCCAMTLHCAAGMAIGRSLAIRPKGLWSRSPRRLASMRSRNAGSFHVSTSSRSSRSVV